MIVRFAVFSSRIIVNKEPHDSSYSNQRHVLWRSNSGFTTEPVADRSCGRNKSYCRVLRCRHLVAASSQLKLASQSPISVLVLVRSSISGQSSASGVPSVIASLGESGSQNRRPKRSSSVLMVLARLASFFTTDSTLEQPGGVARREDLIHSDRRDVVHDISSSVVEDDTEEEARPAYLHASLAGGIGGVCGDMLMHSLDTVKTRQQGDPHRPPKYRSLGPSYFKIFRQEGVWRGLYGGVVPAAVGSFTGTGVFFLTYEWSKRTMIDNGVPPSVAYLSAGLVADLAASPLYVPTEVMKTRLQLQGRFNNPYFESGYNYRSTIDAARTIVKSEGVPALFHGYQATLYRDLPFSALQFAFYEKEREVAKRWVDSKDIGLPLEIFTGMTAGGLAGVITCPLDVVKTRIQTQITVSPSQQPSTSTALPPNTSTIPSSRGMRPSPTMAKMGASAKRTISTSSPSTHMPTPGATTLDTSSVLTGLKMIYKTEGLGGCFRGVGPRAVWTSVQSGTMLVLYQALLKYFDEHPLMKQAPDS